MKMTATAYWDERTVLIHALLGGYTEISGDEIGQTINDILNTPQLLYGSLDCLLELEASKLITTELLELGYINENFLPRTVLRKNKLSTVDKPYTKLKELAADSGFGLGTLEKLVEGQGLKVSVTVNDSQAIRRKLISYLADFTGDTLSTDKPVELWSYAKQKAYLLWCIQNEMKHFGNPMTLRLYEADPTVQRDSRLFTTLFALRLEKIISVQSIKTDKTAGVAYPLMPVFARVNLNRNLSDFAKIIEPFEPEFAKTVEVTEPEGRVRVGNLTLDDTTVTCNGVELPLTPKELAVLTLLMTMHPQTVRYASLRDAYFESESESSKLDNKTETDLMASIYTTVKNLRKNLKQNGANMRIKTHSKIGLSLKI